MLAKAAIGSSHNSAMFWSMAYKVSDALMLLAREGALTHLIANPCEAQVLAEKMGWQMTPLNKVLDLLVHAGLLEKNELNYHVTPATEAVVPLIISESQVRDWHASNQSLSKMVSQGIAADPLNQIKEISYLDNYQGAMASSSRALSLHLFRHGRLPRAGQVLDIGGADGAVVEQLSTLMPNASFVVVDRPPVQAHFDKRIKALDDPLRFQFISDDVNNPSALLEQAKTADAVIISNLLHLLNPAQINALLSRLKDVLPADCQLLIYDQFVDPDKFDVASLMVVDWINLGALFDMSETDMATLLETFGYSSVTARRFPLLPGALVCARTC